MWQEAIPAGVSLLASVFGKDKAKPAVSGIPALSPNLQQPFNQYADLLNQYNQNPYDMSRVNYAQAPTDMFGSQELYNLQQSQGNTPVNPIGMLEPFNQVQKNALSAYANPDYSQGGLSQYMQPFEQARNNALQGINRQSLTDFTNVKGNRNLTGTLARDPLYGGQLPQIEEARARAIGDMESKYMMQALGLRKDSLSDMMNAGNNIWQHNQTALTAASPQSQAQNNPLYAQIMAYQNMLKGIPTNASTGGTPGGPNTVGDAGNLGLTLFGQQLTNLMNGMNPQTSNWKNPDNA